MVAAELDVHQTGHAFGRVGVAVELDALYEAARAVPDAGDRDADLLAGGEVLMLLLLLCGREA